MATWHSGTVTRLTHPLPHPLPPFLLFLPSSLAPLLPSYLTHVLPCCQLPPLDPQSTFPIFRNGTPFSSSRTPTLGAGSCRWCSTTTGSAQTPGRSEPTRACLHSPRPKGFSSSVSFITTKHERPRGSQAHRHAPPPTPNPNSHTRLPPQTHAVAHPCGCPPDPNGWGDLESHNGGACCPPANEIPNDDVGLAKALIEKVDSIAKVR